MLRHFDMKKWAGPVCLFLAFSLAGTSVVTARLVSDKLGIFTITSVSLLFAFLFLLPVYANKLISSLRSLSAKDLLFLGLQAMFGIFLFRIFLLNGLLLTSSIEAGILTGVTPAITAVLAMVVLKEPANVKALTGIIATVAGVITIQGLFNISSGFSLVHLYGNLLVLCAAASESAFNIISRFFSAKAELNKKLTVPPPVQTVLVSSMAFILCLIPALFEAPIQRLSAVGLKEWLSLVWYGVLVTALAFIFWYSGIKRCGAFTAAAFSGMMPFTSMILSVIILREQAGWHQWLGGILVLTGMILVGTTTTPARASNLQKLNRIKEQTVE
ncbi:putative membrane protein [Anaerobacterium chartisolvens]|uniref:Putative membrane protein n=1 Tax=Anaerobacterium chartisolvens TaxID=1297424 RepID=A0A369BEY5_9FIRM|nr:DMT family transporter [Anaerobacterium chartisolvens]RCX20099.1 putative membrane protein [Anaerobacterium chartisolvens]